MKSKILFSLLIFAVVGVTAYEVDNFTQRYEALPDSSDHLNTQVNELLQQISNDTESCDKDDLLNLTYGYVGGGLVGTLEDFLAESPIVRSHKGSTDNIYSLRGLKSKVAYPVLTTMGLNASVNLNGHFIGADKLGHFFSQGFQYHKIYSEGGYTKDALAQALDNGMRSEDGVFGLGTTGVKSYADLASNFSGLAFWLNLTEGRKSYFKCVGNRWIQSRQFDIREYVNSAWDEGINCNTYNPDIAKAVDERTALLEKKSGGKNRYTCPIAPQECIRLKKVYGNNAPKLLSPACLNAKVDTRASFFSTDISAQRPSRTATGQPVIPGAGGSR